MVVVANSCSASSSRVDPLAVDHARLGVAAGEAERGLGLGLAVLGAVERGGEGDAERGVAGAQLHRAEREQRRDVVARAAVVLGRLLVGERGRGLLGGVERVVGGLGRPALEEVVGELGGVRVAVGLQRLADAAVQPHAAARCSGAS